MLRGIFDKVRPSGLLSWSRCEKLSHSGLACHTIGRVLFERAGESNSFRKWGD